MKRASTFILLVSALSLIGCNNTKVEDKGGESLSSLSSTESSEPTISEEISETKKEWNGFKANIEISQKISDSFKLYLKGSWDDYAQSTLLTKVSDFVYEGDVSHKVDSDTVYEYYVLINDDANYKERVLNAKDNQIQFSSDNEQIALTHKVMDFNNYPIVENQWTVLNGPTSQVSETENGIKVQNYSWQSGFVCQKNTLGEDDYKMSAHFKGTKSSPYTDETYIGFVPYYFDNENYLFAYVQWCNWDGYQSVVREIGITGYLNGVSAGWNDIWNTNNVSTMPVTGFTLTMMRSGNTFTATFKGDDNQTFSGSRSFSSLKSGSDYLGLYVQNDTVEIDSYLVEKA